MIECKEPQKNNTYNHCSFMNFMNTTLSKIMMILGGIFFFFAISSFLIPAGVDASIFPADNLQASVEDPFGKEDAKGVHATRDDVDLWDGIVSLINYLLLFIGILLLVIIIYAGVLIILSDGEEDAVTKGRKMIIYAVIGMVIIILSWSIVDWLTDIGSNVE